ncbi:MAG TPA: hypothetical protein VLI90_20870, partial [Tepidisphaeraceae bacterium]|nr:hypothetical protein [Tepidisphaeraceae bacterium]
MTTDAEQKRLDEDRLSHVNWRRWGPYLSERQWGTVREDYSADGSAWTHFSHDQARSRAYRWGEDGIAGISDNEQRLCFAVAMWNGKDSILKERLFGLTGPEGNHGEDVKELYYYLDATPTHSYLKMLYKYPQAEYPYTRLVEENRYRGKSAPEFELIDTGVFNDGRYFDVFVEYAKAGENDILIQITVHNRGPKDAPLHLLPQMWFRNSWSWNAGSPKPVMRAGGDEGPIEIEHVELGQYALFADGGPQLLFTENETNGPKLFGLPHVDGAYYKDAFHEFVLGGNVAAVNPNRSGTKAAALCVLSVPAQGSQRVRLRLMRTAAPASSGPGAEWGMGDLGMPLKTPDQNHPHPNPLPEYRARGPEGAFAEFDSTFERRRREADAFYSDIQTGIDDADARLVQRQAWAGMIWSKQFFYYNIGEWLNGDPAGPPPPASRKNGRNAEWMHLNNANIISMPDKWEYPWYAAWDLAFHCIPFAMIDPEFAKRQLVLLTREWYMHPNGQLPAYEWAFGDVNPPVHAWAALRVYQIDKDRRGGVGDVAF